MNINTPYITQTLNRDTYDNKPSLTMHAVFVASSEEIQPYITQTLYRDTYDNKPLITMHAVFVASSEEIQQGLATDSGSIGIDHITNFPDSSGI